MKVAEEIQSVHQAVYTVELLEGFLDEHGFDAAFDRDGYSDSMEYVSWSLVAMSGGIFSLELRAHGESAPRLIAEMRRILGGTWEKSGNEREFMLRRIVGGVTVKLVAGRERVCRRVVTGTARKVIEARPARVVVEDVVEWKCDPILAD